MRLWKIASPLVLATVLSATVTAAAAADDTACGTLVGPGNASAPNGFQLRGGEPVDFVAGGKTVHGTLRVYVDGSIYRAYWQPQGSAERYVLANAGTNSVRLISTPTRGVPANGGEPGTPMPPQQVLSCPSF